MWIRPYKLLVVSANGGLIEPIPNAISLHQVRKQCEGSLKNYFIKVCYTYVRISCTMYSTYVSVVTPVLSDEHTNTVHPHSCVTYVRTSTKLWTLYTDVSHTWFIWPLLQGTDMVR